MNFNSETMMVLSRVISIIVLIILGIAIYRRDKKIKNLELKIGKREDDISAFSNQLTTCEGMLKNCKAAKDSALTEVEVQKGLVKNRNTEILSLTQKNTQRKEQYNEFYRSIAQHSHILSSIMPKGLVAVSEGKPYKAFNVLEDGTVQVGIKDGRKTIKQDAILGYLINEEDFLPLDRIGLSQIQIFKCLHENQGMTDEEYKELEKDLYGLTTGNPVLNNYNSINETPEAPAE